MENLRFATENQALQHLADITGKRIKVADVEMSDEEEAKLLADSIADYQKNSDIIEEAEMQNRGLYDYIKGDSTQLSDDDPRQKTLQTFKQIDHKRRNK